MRTDRTLDLKSARVIVACGAGVRSEADFDLARRLAECLGAELAGTRPAVDRGFLPPDRMIGQTGVSVRPDVYIALGISGSAQHRSGIHADAAIIAVNSDPRAPICSFADYVIIGDLKQVIPKMISACRDGATIDQIAHSSA